MALTVGVYWVEVCAYDPATLFCTATISVTVQDTTPPIWDETPTDHVVELGASFIYDINASDASGIDLYWVNDTAHFAIDGNGVITNSIALMVGVYWLEVRAYDPTPFYCTATFKVTVQDTTPPTWDETPTDHVVELGTSFIYDVNASDASGIDYYRINDTTHFAVDATGRITSVGLLPVGTYSLTITAFDPYHNALSAMITITVQPPSSPSPPSLIPGFAILAITTGIIAALSIGIIHRRRRSSKTSDYI